MTIIHRADARRTETPNAVMTTLASPTLGGAERSLWRVEMAPGQSGPAHRFDREQVWAVLSGAATVELDGRSLSIGPGDTMILPGGVDRRVHAGGADGFSAIVTGDPNDHASLPDGSDRGTPAWIA